MTGFNWTRAALAVVLVFVVGGCENLKQQVGLGKRSPDEFRVVSRAPLAIPPEFSLRPPAPGAPRPQTGTTTDQARNALFGTPAGSQFRFTGQTATVPEDAQTISQGEQIILDRAGARNADPNIRTVVNRETDQMIDEDENLVDLLVFWRTEQPTGDVVDAQREADRLRENAALGKPVTEGETPTIRRKRTGALLEGIL